MKTTAQIHHDKEVLRQSTLQRTRCDKEEGDLVRTTGSLITIRSNTIQMTTWMLIELRHSIIALLICRLETVELVQETTAGHPS
jgi:hypothetical protein